MFSPQVLDMQADQALLGDESKAGLKQLETERQRREALSAEITALTEQKAAVGVAVNVPSV